ncbi:MAG: DUF6065 family protein [Maricaulaceae bacterium]
MTQSKNIPPNTIRAHVVDGVNINVEEHIRPSSTKRDWMDAVPSGYIYRCIPILAANTMGWELLNPSDTAIVWDGGERIENLKVACQQRGLFTASSHFGSGIATWYVPFLFKTSPDLGLYICSPANHEKKNAQAIEAFVRTDWLPFPFTVNWQINKANTETRFAKGEPIARIMPFPLSLIDETTLEIAALSSDPGFKTEVEEFGKARAANVAAQRANIAKAKAEGHTPSQDGVYNAQYVKSKGAGGKVPHQTIFRPSKPIDTR